MRTPAFSSACDWVAASCQYITGLVVRHLGKEGVHVLNYTDDFGGVATSKGTATNHFTKLRAKLCHLGLTEAGHKASPPSQDMVWLDPRFNTLDMNITIPEANMMESTKIAA